MTPDTIRMVRLRSSLLGSRCLGIDGASVSSTLAPTRITWRFSQSSPRSSPVGFSAQCRIHHTSSATILVRLALQHDQPAWWRGFPAQQCNERGDWPGRVHYPCHWFALLGRRHHTGNAHKVADRHRRSTTRSRAPNSLRRRKIGGRHFDRMPALKITDRERFTDLDVRSTAGAKEWLTGHGATYNLARYLNTKERRRT